MTVSLATSAPSCGSLAEAIAQYELARARGPRMWAHIAEDDVHALLGLVGAIHALQQHARDMETYAVLAARKAGASWADIAGMAGRDVADEYQEDVTREFASMDPPDGAVGEECRRLLSD